VPVRDRKEEEKNRLPSKKHNNQRKNFEAEAQKDNGGKKKRGIKQVLGDSRK